MFTLLSFVRPHQSHTPRVNERSRQKVKQAIHLRKQCGVLIAAHFEVERKKITSKAKQLALSSLCGRRHV